MRASNAALAVLALASATSCAAPVPSRVIVVVSSDMMVPAELGEIVVRASTGGTVMPSADFVLAESTDLPLSFVVARAAGDDAAFRVEVEGRSPSGTVVRRVVQGHFLAHQTRAIDVALLHDCVGASCLDPQLTCTGACRECMAPWTCDDGASSLRAIGGPGSELDGGPTRMDAGPSRDAGPRPDPDADVLYTPLRVLAPHVGASIAAPDLRASRVRLRWAPIPRVVEYRVQLTSECMGGPCGVDGEPTFAHPIELTTTDSSIVPDVDAIRGPARFFWQVQACDIATGVFCGEWTAPRYFDLGRLRDDMNADGLSDIAIVASTPASGRPDTIVVISGSDRSVLSRFTLADASTTLGSEVLLEDLNADAHADVVALLCHGGLCPGTSVELLVLDGASPTPLGSSAPYLAFGLTGGGMAVPLLADVGDVDGDGARDLVVTAPELGTVFHGASDLTAITSAMLRAPTPSIARPSGDCDLDLDGLADVVWPGTDTLHIASTDWWQPGAPGPLVAAACGDRNRDDVADLVAVTDPPTLFDRITDPNGPRTGLPFWVSSTMGLADEDTLVFERGAGSDALVFRASDLGLYRVASSASTPIAIPGGASPVAGRVVAAQALLDTDGMLRSAVIVGDAIAMGGGRVVVLGTGPIATIDGDSLGLAALGYAIASAVPLRIHAILRGDAPS